MWRRILSVSLAAPLVAGVALACGAGSAGAAAPISQFRLPALGAGQPTGQVVRPATSPTAPPFTGGWAQFATTSGVTYLPTVGTIEAAPLSDGGVSVRFNSGNSFGGSLTFRPQTGRQFTVNTPFVNRADGCTEYFEFTALVRRNTLNQYTPDQYTSFGVISPASAHGWSRSASWPSTCPTTAGRATTSTPPQGRCCRTATTPT